MKLAALYLINYIFPVNLLKPIEICTCHVATPTRGVEFLFRQVRFFIGIIENTPKPFDVIGISMFTVHGC